MRFPWANIALLIILIIQVVSGYLGFTNGTETKRWLLWIHGLGAYAITFLLIWKATIVVDSYRRQSKWNWSRLSFAVMALLLLITLMLGLSWTVLGPVYLFGFSFVTLHIFLSVALIGLVIWHFLRYRWILRIPSATNRRGFINQIMVSFAGLIGWSIARHIKQAFDLPGSRRRFTGSYEIGSFTGAFPNVSWIADDPAPIRAADWRLTVVGSMGAIVTFNYKELLDLSTDRISATIDCTGGWYSTQQWLGIRVGHLLEDIVIEDYVRSLTFESITGYSRRFRVDECQDFLLATHVNQLPLTHGHGFPLRLVAPNQRGFNWVKWILKVYLNQSPKWWQSPLPLQ